jgi:RNA polymerase sigma factor (sigma-70 family)
MRGEQYWKRRTRREEIRRKKKGEAVPADEGNRKAINALIDQHLDMLNSFVRRELAYHQKRGDLVPDDPTPEELVDSVTLRAYGEFGNRPARLEIDRWLIKLAIEQIESEINRTKSERENLVYVGEVLPEVPLMNKDPLEADEPANSYRPEEELKLEAIIPNMEIPPPEATAEVEELQSYINNVLASLPKAWRKAFVLHMVDGLSLKEVARVTGLSDVEVKHYLEYAADYLRQKLIESGLKLKKSGKAEPKSKARKAAL